MKVSLSDEQKEIVRSIRSLFAHECPPSLIRQLQNPGVDAKPASLWAHLAQTGVFGLVLPEEVGGQNAMLFDLGLVYEEGGRALCPTLVHSTIEFGLALSRLASPAKASRWLSKAAAGELLGTIALADPGDGSNTTPSLHADLQGSHWTLAGSLDFVPNADAVDMLLTTARVSGADSVSSHIAVLVPRTAIKAQRRSTFARDNQCRVDLDGVQLDGAHVFCGPEGGIKADDLRWIANATTSLHCMDMVGGAQAVIERTVAYLQDRHQFGRPIASFQAAQHHIANMHIAVEGARLAAYQAVSLVGKGRIAERETAIAKLKANEAYKFTTLTAHQLHGGMGFMREFDLHLWSERAKAMEHRDGAWDTQIRRIASVLALEPGRE
ncbi:alkylation response protein AidB-like acyl-CoA dehydrogenase [Bradyrhizobium sp. USDA 4509]